MHRGGVLSINLQRTSLPCILSDKSCLSQGAHNKNIQSSPLPQAPKEGPFFFLALQILHWLDGSGSQAPSPRPVLSLSSLVQLDGRHMETVSIYPAPPGCCRMLCSSGTETLDSPQGRFRGCMQSSQLFCRERLGPVTSAQRKRYHLCKQVILVCLPVLLL